MSKSIFDVITPALVVDLPGLLGNLKQMAGALPGSRLRPHVKAHKCTALAKLQAQFGHKSFTCATVREVVTMAQAGLNQDLMLANEVLNLERLRGLDARVTLAVDSEATVDAAAAVVRDVVIDVDVGLHRCGCVATEAGRLARYARSKGLSIRGVLGYEGHAVHIQDRQARAQATRASMSLLALAHRDVGGDVISGGGTGTYECNTFATEIQAGSYALMDAEYAALGLPFRPALYVLATVIHTSADRTVVDCGLKALGMDRGPPTIDGCAVLSVTDEHTTFRGGQNRVGQRVRVWPAHVDPTVAYHERIYVVDADVIQDCWPVDLRGW